VPSDDVEDDGGDEDDGMIAILYLFFDGILDMIDTACLVLSCL